MTPRDQLEAALDYARRKYPPFPVGDLTKISPFPKGAHPLYAPDPNGEAGHKRATADLDLITRWWPLARGITVGIVPPEGVAFIDADEKHVPGVVDLIRSTWPELESNGLHTTRSNGAHFVGRIPAGATLPQSVNRDLGIDVRASLKGYVVAPPATGYTVVVPFRHVDDLDPIPVGLIELLTEAAGTPPAPAAAPPPLTAPLQRLKSYVWSAVRGEHDRVAATPEGARNDTLHRSAVRLGSLVGAGMLSERDAYDALMAGVHASASPLPDREAHDAINRGLAYGIRNPRQLHKDAP